MWSPAFFLIALCCVQGLSSYRTGAWRKSFGWHRSARFATEARPLSPSYLRALQQGTWVKFICGASNEHLPLVRNLCYIYALAGVDCVDVSASAAVVCAAASGIDAVSKISHHRPLLMISVNAGQDNHFRKARFDARLCPAHCRRPCERACPAVAISAIGVDEQKCYGCGRCVPACPYDLIATEGYHIPLTRVRELLHSGLVNALEIHANGRDLPSFHSLWTDLAESIAENVRVLSISLTDKEDAAPQEAEDVNGQYISSLQHILADDRRRRRPAYRGVQVWQADGRSMSGDLGRSTVGPATRFAKQLLTSPSLLRQSSPRSVDFASGRHFVQLAGGVNNFSLASAVQEGLVSLPGFGGFGFGGYARRTLVQRLLPLSVSQPDFLVEDFPQVLDECMDFARQVVAPCKARQWTAAGEGGGGGGEATF